MPLIVGSLQPIFLSHYYLSSPKGSPIPHTISTMRANTLKLTSRPLAFMSFGAGPSSLAQKRYTLSRLMHSGNKPPSGSNIGAHTGIYEDTPMPNHFIGLKRAICASVGPDFASRATYAWREIIEELSARNQDIIESGTDVRASHLALASRCLMSK
jgi:hypothetical protein